MYNAPLFECQLECGFFCEHFMLFLNFLSFLAFMNFFSSFYVFMGFFVFIRISLENYIIVAFT